MAGPASCCVSIQVGVKHLPDGVVVDHESVYRGGVRTVLERLWIQAIRADELTGGATVMKSLFASLLSSDLMIADISGRNPNVMYESVPAHASSRVA